MVWMNQKNKEQFYKDSVKLIQHMKKGSAGKDYIVMDSRETYYYKVYLYHIFCEELNSYVAVLQRIDVADPNLSDYSVVSDWQGQMPKTIQDAKQYGFIPVPNKEYYLPRGN